MVSKSLLKKHRPFLLILIGSFTGITNVMGADRQSVSNGEYGFAMTFPRGYSICNAQSGGHVHGYFIRFDKRGCEDATRGPSMGLYADYDNSGLSDAKSDFPPGCAPPPSGSLMSRLRIGRKKSAVGWREGDDGLTEVFVKALVSDRSRSRTAKNESLPVIYSASLVTNGQKIDEDLKKFYQMAASISIERAP